MEQLVRIHPHAVAGAVVDGKIVWKAPGPDGVRVRANVKEGIGIHPSSAMQYTPTGDHWALVHVPTGVVIRYGFLNKWLAALCRKVLLELGDWEAGEDHPGDQIDHELADRLSAEFLAIRLQMAAEGMGERAAVLFGKPAEVGGQAAIDAEVRRMGEMQ